MTEFFSSMPNDLFTFWMIAIPFSIFMGLQMILTFAAGFDGDIDVDSDSDVDADGEGDDSAPFQLFTLRNFVAFMAVFGWTGIVSLNNGISLTMAVFISTLAGLAMVVVLSSIFFFTAKLASNTTPDVGHAVGREGTVYLTIPEMSKGKVNIMYGGALRTVDAWSMNGTRIPTGTRIQVVDAVDGEVWVKTVNVAEKELTS